MSEKVSPDAKILIWPQSAIPQLNKQGFTVADRFSNLLFAGSGAQSIGFEEINPTATPSWTSGQFYFTALANDLSFVRFNEDGTAAFGIPKQQGGSFLSQDADVAGFFLRPRLAHLDAKIGGTALDTDLTDIHLSGLLGTWSTVMAPGDVEHCDIYNTALEAGGAIAVSDGDIPANRSLAFDLYLSTGASGQRANARITVGDKWSIRAQHDQPFTVEKQNLSSTSTTPYDIVKTLEGSHCDFKGGRYLVTFLRLAGRGVVIIKSSGATQAWWFWDTQSPVVPGSGSTNPPKPKEVTWPAAPLQFDVFGGHARIGIRVVKWCLANGTPLSASGTRRIVRYTDLGTSPVVSSGYGGWAREGTSIAIAPDVGTNEVTYGFTLTGSADGIDTPLLQNAYVKFTPAHNEPAPSPLDIRMAVRSVEVNLALPPNANGSTATIEIDRQQLEKKFPSHADYLQDYSPVEVQVHWRMDDGNYSDWVTLFKGYNYAPADETTGYNEQARTLFCLDEVCRSIKPAGFIDQRYPPLAVKIMEKAAAATAAPGSSSVAVTMHGAELVQEVVRLIHGDAIASGINGNGDPLRYLPAGHPPLWSNDSDHAGYLTIAAAFGEATTLPVLSQGGWLFPAPYGSDGYSWWNQYARDDRCVGFFERGTFIYGRLMQILATRTKRRVADRDAAPGDINNLIRRLSSEKRPEKDINRAVVWSLPDDGLTGILPALRVGEDRLQAPDPGAAVYTWERTHLTTTAFAMIGAEAIAKTIISQIAGMVPKWPSFTMPRGDEHFLAGDIPHLITNDATIGLNDLYVRAEVVRHRLSFNRELSFTTEVFCRPLTSDEKASAGIS